jgi:poly(3-hydroxybutyrate) depolymerase
MHNLVNFRDFSAMVQSGLFMRRLTFQSSLLYLYLSLLISSIALMMPATASIPAGKHQFSFSQWQGSPLEVWAYTPTGYKANSKVLFVMHGTNRDADRYRDEWAELSEAHNVLLIVPQFNQQDFGRALGYNLGNVFTSNKYDQVNPREIWAYSAIEPLFDLVKEKYGNTSDSYHLYGHSAGSQFVHRFIFFVPEARVSKIVTANAGWYTVPDFKVSFPYGLKNTPVTQKDVIASLQKPVVVLLGEADNDPQHPSLRRAEPAMRQGKHRFERGHYFYQQAQLAAEEFQVDFKWKLATVPEVGHSNGLMAKAAIKHLID